MLSAVFIITRLLAFVCLDILEMLSALVIFHHRYHLVRFPIRTLSLYLLIFFVEPEINPCQPSPCGLFSQCRVANGHAVCSCQANYIGSPPACRPECTVSTDCMQDKACINQKCLNPCSGTCGINSRCNVINHNPICSCSPGFNGDPFVRCIQEESKKMKLIPIYLSISITFFSFSFRAPYSRTKW